MKVKVGRKPIPLKKVIESLQEFYAKKQGYFTLNEYDSWPKKICCGRVIMVKFNKGWHACLAKAGIK